MAEAEKERQKKSSARSEYGGVECDSEEGKVESGAKVNTDSHTQVEVAVEVDYVPEKADIDEGFLEEFKSVIEKFNFRDYAGGEDGTKKDETAVNAIAKKEDSDSEEDEQESQQKEKGLSNKKKKHQKRMKIAEL